MFSEILNSSETWDEIVNHLTANKLERESEVLSIPDFDTSEEILQVLIGLPTAYQDKLLSDKPQYVQLRKELFPNNVNIDRLREYRQEKSKIGRL